MTPVQITRSLAQVGRVTIALNQIAALKEAARLVGEYLPVRWSFEPGTPAGIVDYLAGAVEGAAEGAAAGLGIGLLLALVFPPSVIGYAALGGAVVGAAGGIERVEQGWRIRLVADVYGRPLLDVQRVA